MEAQKARESPELESHSYHGKCQGNPIEPLKYVNHNPSSFSSFLRLPNLSKTPIFNPCSMMPQTYGYTLQPYRPPLVFPRRVLLPLVIFPQPVVYFQQVRQTAPFVPYIGPVLLNDELITEQNSTTPVSKHTAVLQKVRKRAESAN